MVRGPSEERRGVKIILIPELANNGIRSALGCREYKRNAGSRYVDLTREEHPCYAGLGAVSDFDDELLGYAYDRQIACDPQNTPYYLECLQILAEGRRSDDLQTKVAIESTQERTSLRDIRIAYRHFGINMLDTFNDDNIIGIFQARLADSPKQEQELRTDLQRIGQYRKSETLKLIASQGQFNKILIKLILMESSGHYIRAGAAVPQCRG